MCLPRRQVLHFFCSCNDQYSISKVSGHIIKRSRRATTGVLCRFIRITTNGINATSTTLGRRVPQGRTIIYHTVMRRTTQQISQRVSNFRFHVTRNSSISVIRVDTRKRKNFLRLRTRRTTLFQHFIGPRLVNLINFNLRARLFRRREVTRSVIRVRVNVRRVFRVRPVLNSRIFRNLLFFFVGATQIGSSHFVNFIPGRVAILQRRVGLGSLCFRVVCLSLSPCVCCFLYLRRLLFGRLLRIPRHDLILSKRNFISRFTPLRTGRSIKRYVLLFKKSILTSGLR